MPQMRQKPAQIGPARFSSIRPITLIVPLVKTHFHWINGIWYGSCIKEQNDIGGEAGDRFGQLDRNDSLQGVIATRGAKEMQISGPGENRLSLTRVRLERTR